MINDIAKPGSARSSPIFRITAAHQSKAWPGDDTCWRRADACSGLVGGDRISLERNDCRRVHRLIWHFDADDLRDIGSAEFSDRISQISQEAWLIQGSIADSISIGCPTTGDAACLAGVDEIVGRLPKGFGTLVGEGGTRLSRGGARQLVTIARALIKPTPILLIVEASAALDAENQAAIAWTLSRLRGRCTMIVIAHQLSTIRMADRIVVLDKDQVAEQGSASELAAAGRIYARLAHEGRAAKGWRIGPEA